MQGHELRKIILQARIKLDSNAIILESSRIDYRFLEMYKLNWWSLRPTLRSAQFPRELDDEQLVLLSYETECDTGSYDSTMRGGAPLPSYENPRRRNAAATC